MRRGYSSVELIVCVKNWRRIFLGCHKASNISNIRFIYVLLVLYLMSIYVVVYVMWGQERPCRNTTHAKVIEHVNERKRTRVSTYISTFLLYIYRTLVCTHTHTHTNAHTNTYIYTQTRSLSLSYTRTYTYTQTRTPTHICVAVFLAQR